MAVLTEVKLFESVRENRWSAEFFNPIYTFSQNEKYRWVRIGNILKKYQYGISIAMNQDNNGFPIYRMNEIEDCFLTKAEKCADISEKEFAVFKLEFNDILFNRTNSFEFVGRTGILKHNTEAVFASYLIKVVPDKEYILPEFLMVYLNTKFGIGQIKRRAMHSINQANVSASELKRIPIPIIEKGYQQKIATLVDDTYKLKDKSSKLYIQAEQLLEQELGLDKIEFENPISHKASFSEVLNFFRIDSEYFRPRYRQIRELIGSYQNGHEPLLANINGISPNINPKNTPNDSFHYIELSNINPRIGVVTGFNEVKGKNAPSRAKRLVDAGDIIASSVVGSVDKSALISNDEADYLASTGFFQFRSDTYSPEFLLILVKSLIFQEQLRQQATGGILSAVPDSNLRHVIIPVVPEKLQDEITGLVKKSHENYRKSQLLLAQAKQRVEELIEEGIN